MNTQAGVQRIAAWFRTLVVRSERAASLVEYALLVALIALVCVAAVSSLGEEIPGKFSSANAPLVEP